MTSYNSGTSSRIVWWDWTLNDILLINQSVDRIFRMYYYTKRPNYKTSVFPVAGLKFAMWHPCVFDPKKSISEKAMRYLILLQNLRKKIHRNNSYGFLSMSCKPHQFCILNYCYLLYALSVFWLLAQICTEIFICVNIFHFYTNIKRRGV